MRKLLLLFPAVTACVPNSWNPMQWGKGSGGGGKAADSAPRPDPVRRDLASTSVAKGLVRLTDTKTNEDYPALSPDGKLVLASSWMTDPDSGETAASSIVAVKPTGGPVTSYTSRGIADCPIWLGKSFAYASDALGSRSLVRALKPTPNAATQVVVGGQTAPELCATSASPDGRTIALHTRTGDDFSIATVEPGGGSFTVIAEGAFPRISPDGKTIAFHRKVQGEWQVFTIGIDGDGLTQVTNGKTSCETPTWSPDGKWLVMACNDGWKQFGDDPAAVYNLFAIRPDGSDATALTTGGHGVQHPSWARDGWIYFASNMGGNWDLWRTQPQLPD